MEPHLVIDGRRIDPGSDEFLLGVLDRNGIHVPRLCHHPAVRPYGACRLCLVESVRPGGSKLVTACTVPAREGGTFLTDTARVRRMRRLVIELHLARCPGSAAIRDLARSLGVRASRFRQVHDTCILCGLCERVCREVVGANALCYEGRGSRRVITSSFDEVPDECIACGACSHVCPTDAIHMREAAVQALLALPGSERPCRHALTGIYPGALCSHSYQCDTCEVDQRLHDAAGTNPAMALAGGEAARALFAHLAVTRGAHGDGT